jgi:hypothetical protein
VHDDAYDDDVYDDGIYDDAYDDDAYDGGVYEVLWCACGRNRARAGKQLQVGTC